MTAKEIKDINREITRLKAKIARIAAEADNTSPKLSDLPSSGQTSDKVGNLALVCYGWEEASAVLLKYIKLKADSEDEKL